MIYKPEPKCDTITYQVERLDGWVVGQWSPVSYELSTLTLGLNALAAYRAEQPDRKFRLIKVIKKIEVVDGL